MKRGTMMTGSPRLEARCRLRPRIALLSPTAALVLQGLLFSTAATAAVVSISCHTSSPQPGGAFVSEVTIDVGSTALGAYTVAVTYDQTVVTIASVAGGTTAEFADLPSTNPKDFASGSTHFCATTCTRPASYS